MQSLANKKIILGVCGGIAAYKSADLVRRLIETGAEVQVVMTGHAEHFVSPLTFQALSGNPVRHTLFDEAAEAAMGHIELARWADLILIAPATAGFIARLAHGLADDLLSTLCLATRAPIAIAPAMNQAMWENTATRANMAIVQDRGIAVFGPASGSQACGETGAGRMLEALEIRDLCVDLLSETDLSLAGRQILLTTGPTRESIDPVRYISNHSSGKMGFALAEAARDAGASVTVVSGPVSLSPPNGIDIVRVQSAAEMLDAVLQHAPRSDVFISVAAVADFRLKTVETKKIKKSADELTLTLVKNPDILAEVAALKKHRPYCVGFAAETHDLQDYAKEKLKNKNLDMIAANLVTNDSDTVFNSDSNTLEVFLRDSRQVSLPHAPKRQIARQLIALIAEQLNERQS
ncbi:MAG: bifunctional phosphopantothenoylcysteine decarboxylase/phosphopantothenate--cysteine ligase CoaBC, partial [Gammaproteobacteria bacterium]|nr:bifunctional phosphopantothenoylcysteine decarboxylase/phosphopantothenate--cysteine ligase CoaBC [Gammaproteobacteria bacterium]